MKHELHTEADVNGFPLNGAGRDRQTAAAAPKVLSVSDVLALDTPAPSMLIESILPERGASLIVGAPKSNKTLLALQLVIAEASGNPFLENYKVLRSGPALIVEQDDPAGAASIKDILKRSPVSVAGIPFHLVERVPFNFGVELLEWLEKQILALKLRLVVLDSYTALRGSRGSGIDIVKSEQNDLMLLDDLAKRTGCAIVIIHHASKSSAALDWSDQAAGTFAMSAATQSQIHVSRFRELEGNAPERLIRIRGRHQEGVELVVRFRKDTLDHEHVLEGGAAPLYPLLRQIRSELGSQTFGPKELAQATGVSRATAAGKLNACTVRMHSINTVSECTRSRVELDDVPGGHERVERVAVPYGCACTKNQHYKSLNLLNSLNSLKKLLCITTINSTYSGTNVMQEKL